MHYSLLLWGVIGTAVTATLLVCARNHHIESAREDVFSISPFVGYVASGLGLAVWIIPLAPDRANHRDLSTIPAVALMSALVFAAAIYFFRYQVTVNEEALTIRTFRRRVTPFTDVIDWDVIRGRKSSELWVYLRNGNTLKIPGSVGDFDELPGLINSYMAWVPGQQQDSEAKPRDRKARERENRVANLMGVIGLALVAAVAFLLWRLDLLG